MVAMLLPLQAIQDYRWVTLPAEADRILRPLGPSALLVDVLVARSRASLWDWSWDDAPDSRSGRSRWPKPWACRRRHGRWASADRASRRR